MTAPAVNPTAVASGRRGAKNPPRPQPAPLTGARRTPPPWKPPRWPPPRWPPCAPLPMVCAWSVYARCVSGCSKAAFGESCVHGDRRLARRAACESGAGREIEGEISCPRTPSTRRGYKHNNQLRRIASSSSENAVTAGPSSSAQNARSRGTLNTLTSCGTQSMRSHHSRSQTSIWPWIWAK